MNLKGVLIFVMLFVVTSIPLALRLSFAENSSQPLALKPLEKVKKALKPLKAKNVSVAKILKTKRCVG